MSTMGMSFNSLEGAVRYGVNPLTGEACNFGMRLLCDVSERGKRNLELFMGVAALTLNGNANSYVGAEESVGSIFLTHSTLWEFIAFCALAEGYEYVIPCQPEHHGVYAYSLVSDRYWEYHRDLGDKYRLLRNPHRVSIINVAA